MKQLNLDQMASLHGGADSCKVLSAFVAVACVASSFGLIAALIAGPTCVGGAIGYAIGC